MFKLLYTTDVIQGRLTGTYVACDWLKTTICNTALTWVGQGTPQARNYCLLSNITAELFIQLQSPLMNIN